jgi:2,4-dienoyl-CoA reductase-like NADH-dependent reductase (Old Yellow Enzyme family)
MSALFSPLSLRSVTLPNRIAMSPMCQYMADDGVASPWHMVHLGSRAVGGTGLIIAEATAVEPRGRLTPGCLGLWTEAQAEALAPVTDFIKSQGSVPAIQLAHGGRKAARHRPWHGNGPLTEGDGWEIIAPSAVPFGNYQMPRAMTDEDCDTVEAAFVNATHNARRAGFTALTLHFAHGYLMHQFFSPLSNLRGDRYGGNLAARSAFPLRVAEAVRRAWPDDLPLLVRLSFEDWRDGGLGPDEGIEIARAMKAIGVDLIECSSAGLVADEQWEARPGYQVEFARRTREEAGIATGAVGVIIDAHQAEGVIASGSADIVILARAQLDDPHWALHAAEALGIKAPWPLPYGRGVQRLRGFQAMLSDRAVEA